MKDICWLWLEEAFIRKFLEDKNEGKENKSEKYPYSTNIGEGVEKYIIRKWITNS